MKRMLFIGTLALTVAACHAPAFGSIALASPPCDVTKKEMDLYRQLRRLGHPRPYAPVMVCHGFRDGYTRKLEILETDLTAQYAVIEFACDGKATARGIVNGWTFDRDPVPLSRIPNPERSWTTLHRLFTFDTTRTPDGAVERAYFVDETDFLDEPCQPYTNRRPIVCEPL